MARLCDGLLALDCGQRSFDVVDVAAVIAEKLA
jgi:hypothetical protein